MKTIAYIIATIAFLVLIGIVINYSIESGKSEVYEWAEENNMQVKSIETHLTQFGTPFYYLNKGSYIYEVEMSNGEKWWCRTGLFGNNDWEKGK